MHNSGISSSGPVDGTELDGPSKSHFLAQRSESSVSQNIANLISALDDTVQDVGLDQTLSILGDEALNRCLDLRTLLRKRTSELHLAATNTAPSSSQPAYEFQSHDSPNLPNSVPAFSLTPWTGSTIPSSLPPLPRVLDPTLEAAAFIHNSNGPGRLTDLSYERLEWVGDAYLYLTSTLFISQTFPSFLPGKCSQLRERLVKNVTLADYARQYGFEKRAVFSEKTSLWNSAKENDKTKILGDIFEAYVAAIVLSDPQNGVIRVTQWLKELWGMTIRKEILSEERSGIRIDSPLWRLRGAAVPIEIASSEPATLNAKDALMKAIGAKGITISYREVAPVRKDQHTKLPLFTMGVYLDGWGEKDKQLGYGAAGGKKEAGMKAAEMALGNKKMLKVYIERKRVHQAQMDVEREIVEKQSALAES